MVIKILALQKGVNYEFKTKYSKNQSYFIDAFDDELWLY